MEDIEAKTNSQEQNSNFMSAYKNKGFRALYNSKLVWHGAVVTLHKADGTQARRTRAWLFCAHHQHQSNAGTLLERFSNM